MRKFVFVLIILSMVLAGCTTVAPATTGRAGRAHGGACCRIGTRRSSNRSRSTARSSAASTRPTPGFAIVSTDGNYFGLDIDLCRAVATAIFNDPTAVEFVPTTGETRFTLLQNGDIDVLVRSTTHTFTHDTHLALNFAPTYFYDGQGIMVRKDSGITKLEDLNGSTICMGRGATTELNIADAMA